MEEVGQDEKEWSDKATESRLKYHWLSFFTNRDVLEIYKLVKSSDPSIMKAHHIIKHLRFLITPSYSINQLHQAVVANIVRKLNNFGH